MRGVIEASQTEKKKATKNYGGQNYFDIILFIYGNYNSKLY